MNPLPYESIGEYPEDHSSGNIVKRLIDGLGYRYYWATETLTEDDLAFKPGETNRTSLETLEHLLGLSSFILNTAKGSPNVRPREGKEYSWEEMRRQTLENLFEAAALFSGQSSQSIEGFEIKFKRGENTSSVPFWHLINGPIADALTHVGQIVSNRRASGNPLDPRVSVFNGVTK